MKRLPCEQLMWCTNTMSATTHNQRRYATMEHEANKAIVRRLYEQAFNHTGDLSAIEEFVASDFIDHAAPPGLSPGREGFRQAVLAWRHAFPDITLTVDSIVAEGDTVAI